MLEEKVEELKLKNIENDLDNNKILEKKKVDTSIELNIEAYLNSSLFESDLDKLNFYKEIESINTLEELNELKSEFEAGENTLSKSEENLFKILKIRIKASEYKIKSIKRS
jgi:transcription-repair coupling factor (superfamily II helicase)